MISFVSSTCWVLTVCDIHFSVWKWSKFNFVGSYLWFILICKISEFSRWKLWDQNFVPFPSGNIHIKESKKPSFTFSIELRTKLLWSKVPDKVLNTHLWPVFLTLSRRTSLLYRNLSIGLQSKSKDWFLSDRDLHHKRVNYWSRVIMDSPNVWLFRFSPIVPFQ